MSPIGVQNVPILHSGMLAAMRGVFALVHAPVCLTFKLSDLCRVYLKRQFGYNNETFWQTLSIYELEPGVMFVSRIN